MYETFVELSKYSCNYFETIIATSLQMTAKEQIDQFYRDVETLGLKFPVATIAAKTGFSKGNVSIYLSRKKEPSESFLKKFYFEFKESFTNVPRETNGAHVGDPLLQAILNLTESNKILASNNERLVWMLKPNSGDNVVASQPSEEKSVPPPDQRGRMEGSLDIKESDSTVKKRSKKGSVAGERT